AAAVATEGGELLRRLLRLAAWVGIEGKPVTKRGELAKQEVHSVAEVLELPVDVVKVLWGLPPLSALWQLVSEFDVLTVFRPRVLPGSGVVLVEAALRATGSAAEAIELWSDIFDELVQPVPPPDSPAKANLTREWMQIWGPRFLRLLYSQCPNGEFADFNELNREMFTGRQMVPAQDTEVFKELATLIVAKTLADLEEPGGVHVSLPARPV